MLFFTVSIVLSNQISEITPQKLLNPRLIRNKLDKMQHCDDFSALMSNFRIFS